MMRIEGVMLREGVSAIICCEIGACALRLSRPVWITIARQYFSFTGVYRLRAYSCASFSGFKSLFGCESPVTRPFRAQEPSRAVFQHFLIGSTDITGKPKRRNRAPLPRSSLPH